MTDPIDWSQTTHEGNRRRQHLEFLALPLREKFLRIEQMCDVARELQKRRTEREAKQDESDGEASA